MDEDGDGYLAEACGGDDCLDSDPDVNPGVYEAFPGDPACSDGIDNNCNGYMDTEDAGCVEAGGWALGESADASVHGTPSSREGSAMSNLFLAILLPVGVVILFKRFFAGK